MVRWFFVTSLIGLALGQDAGTTGSSNVEETEALSALEDASKRPENFPWAIYQHISADFADKNVIFCPPSIYIALGMVYEGTRGETRKTIREALNWSEESSDVQKLMTDIQDNLVSNENLTLTSANRIFLDKSVALSSDYDKILESVYHAGAASADFRNNANQEIDSINGWVSQKTNDVIKELFKHGDFKPTTLFVLVNAMYFKANWETKFDEDRNQVQTFHAPSGPVNATFMANRIKVPYTFSSFLQAEIIRLPYTDLSTTFTVVLPHEGTPLSDVEAKLDAYVLHTFENDLRNQLLQLTLPKFNASAAIDLPESLRKLGLGVLFEEPDFSGMLTQPIPMKVDKAVHKAFVAVDEKGTTAAAATGVVGVFRSGRVYIPVTCDRPFLFFIKRNSHVLFMGRVMDPTAEQ